MKKARKNTPEPQTCTVFTKSELCKYLGVCPNTITTYVREGMPVIYLGRVKRPARGARTRYHLEKVMNWLDGRS